MAIYNGDNSWQMNHNTINDSLLNTMKKTSEKTVENLGYDKTILASIQYCSDATLGQYKIRYQNGYYTAYAQDKSVVYSNGANVYVLVPGNDMSNKKFITGLVDNDNALRTYISNLDGDQLYSLTSKNLFTTVEETKLSSYDPASMTALGEGNIVTLYKRGDSAAGEITINKIGLDEQEVNKAFSRVDPEDDSTMKYIRFGATFQTTFEDYRKMVQGSDYGIRLYITYQDEKGQFTDLHYDLNTFNLEGNPFEFTTPSPRYAYFQIDTKNFMYIQRIEAYMKGFPQIAQDDHRGDDPTAETYYDLSITNLSLYTAKKMYSYENDKYRVKLNYADTGPTLTDTIQEIKITAEFTIDGIPVTDPSQKVNYYWGKEDVSVDSIGHGKYNSYLGKGWRCLNTWYAKETTSIDPEELKNVAYTSTDMPDGNVKIVGWNSLNPIILTPNQLKGKRTLIKCVAVYENTPYSVTEYFMNENGKYVLFKSTNPETMFTTSIVAGVFSDNPDITLPPRDWTLKNYNSNVTSPYTFVWEETKFDGTKTVLPDTVPINFYQDINGWNQQYDNVNTSDADVATYLAQNPLFETCLDRFDYYNNYLINTQATTEGLAVARRRLENIYTKRQIELNELYVENQQNELGYHLLGPAAMTVKKIDSAKDYSYDNVEIDEITPYYYSTNEYNTYHGRDPLHYPTYQKTNYLYQLNVSNIVGISTFRITVLEEVNPSTHEKDVIETVSLSVTMVASSALEYNLQITNGTQTFLYNAGGKSPSSQFGNSNPLVIKPLTFVLYDNKTGDKIYDSSEPDAQENNYNPIDEFKPQWTFHTSKTLLTTGYLGSNNCFSAGDSDTSLYVLKNSKDFVYNIAEEYNVNYKERSNIRLQIEYKGVPVTASTNFTFIKQGELGTNGTEYTLDIEDTIYEDYRSDVLDSPEFSVFNMIEDKDKKETETYFANERNLGNTYMYATQLFKYDGNSNIVSADNDYTTATFGNLKFAQSEGIKNSYYQVVGSNSITVNGYWNEVGKEREAVDPTSSWSIETGGRSTESDNRYFIDSTFRVGNEKGSSTTLILDNFKQGMNPPIYYLPTPLTNFALADGTTSTRVSNNIVRCCAKKEIGSQGGIERENYGYYPIPFFYYNVYDTVREVRIIDDLDPTRYFCVMGGFNQVIYDSKGYNPEYNKQLPFKFHMFDENHNDITDDVVSNGHIYWNCSKGFNKSTPFDISNLQEYGSSYITGNQSLLGIYCIYDNGTERAVYHCIRRHKKNGIKEIKDSQGNVVQTFQPGEFVTPFWEKVCTIKGTGSLSKSMSTEEIFTPAPAYQSIAADDLFNSWIMLRVVYEKNDKRYTGVAFLPINILCNKYGSDEINGWDGKKTKVEDSFIISSKVAAGRKELDNSFTGITIGETFYDNDHTKKEVGLFGYGKFKKNSSNPNTWGRTLFLDAESGLAMFGPTGSTQIILNPQQKYIYSKNKYDWSRIAGWYVSRDFLYKPLGEDNLETVDFSKISSGEYEIQPAQTPYGSAGIYAPWHVGPTDEYGEQQELADDTVFIWASSQYKSSDSIAVKEAKDALMAQQRLLLRKYGPNVYGEGKGIKFMADYTIKESSQLYVTRQLFLARKKWTDIIWFLEFRRDNPGVEPGMIIEPGTPDDPGEKIYRQYSPSGPRITEEDYQTEVVPYNGTEAINDQITVDEGKETEAAEDQVDFQEAVDLYVELLNTYNATLATQGSGHATTYKNFNSKKSNFYVTYGGKLHCTDAEIEGNITANAGYIGQGKNRLEISVTKNDGQQSHQYLLWNKNFYVRGDTTNDDSEPSVYMKGRIMANSGMFGKVGNKIDGYSKKTMFIQYSWYPWNLPDNATPWGWHQEGDPQGTTRPYLNTTAGKVTKYILYHPNFYIKESGDAFFNGVLYSQEGRLGDWVITDKMIKDVRDTIWLVPGTGQQESQRGYIRVGTTWIRDNGTIEIYRNSDVGPEGPLPGTKPIFKVDTTKLEGDNTNITVNGGSISSAVQIDEVFATGVEVQRQTIRVGETNYNVVTGLQLQYD